MTHKSTALVMCLICLSLFACAQQLESPIRKNDVIENRSKDAEVDGADNKAQRELETIDGGNHPVSAAPSQQKADQHKSAPNTEPYPVKIVSQPGSDAWYIAYVVITAVAMIIGAGTLIALWRQTSKLGEQVNATRDSVDIAISGERAWLFESQTPQVQTNPLRCMIQFTNFGNSPAWIATVGGSFQRINTPDDLSRDPQYGAINWGDVLPVMPGEQRAIQIRNQIANDLPDYSRLAIFVHIRYRDRFSLKPKEPRSMKFCFISADNSMMNWYKGGPVGYNEYD